MGVRIKTKYLTTSVKYKKGKTSLKLSFRNRKKKINFKEQ